MPGTPPTSKGIVGPWARARRFLVYFAALRPIFVLGFLVAYLPLTTIPWMPGSTMLGNLFVEYGFWEALQFGAALLTAAWTLALLAGLALDAERDVQRAHHPKAHHPK